jgi:hypothetical protein
MSDQPPVHPSGQGSRRNPLVTALLIFVSVILLLPGLCSLIFAGVTLTHGGLFGPGSGVDSPIVILWLICLLISAGGVALIMFAIRR